MSAGGSHAHFSLHVGTDWNVRCSAPDNTTPILSVDVGGTHLMITPAGREATESAVQFARELVLNAQTFAADVERLAGDFTPAQETEPTASHAA